jgi:hypothetical protein
MHRTQTHAKYVRMAPPRPAETLSMPAETNTSHTNRLCEKTLQEHPRSCKASGATPASALARPHGTTQHPGGKNVPSASVSLCGILTDITIESRGLLSGTALGSPEQPGEIPFSFANNANELTKHNTHSHGPVAGPTDLQASAAHHNSRPQHPSGETPLRLRGTTPH